MGSAQDGAGHDEAGLDAIRFRWAEAYDIGWSDEDGYHARRRDGLGGLMRSLDAPGLAEKIADDFALRAVPPQRSAFARRRRVSGQPGVVPGTGGYVDQVVRWEEFKALHQSAECENRPPAWSGSVVVDGKRVEVHRADLKDVIDDLEKAIGASSAQGTAGGA